MTIKNFKIVFYCDSKEQAREISSNASKSNLCLSINGHKINAEIGVIRETTEDYDHVCVLHCHELNYLHSELAKLLCSHESKINS